MKTALVIMAAGLGTRFGEGIKQLTPVGQNGEIIMDYSIHDAIEAGFNEIIFIIRRDIERAFNEAIGDRIRAEVAPLGVTVKLAYQELCDLPEGFSCPEERTKPWGTGQAVLAAREAVEGPFCVINADDYYGKEALREIYKFLTAAEEENALCMAGYVLGNTLSETGGVTRGVCSVDENGMLTGVTETRHIIKTASGAEADGIELDPGSMVSMNMWGLPRSFMALLEEGFEEFLRARSKELTGEFLLPIFINKLLGEGRVSVKVLPTNDRWFGVTYKEDTPGVIEAFKRFSDEGVYKAPLFSDIEKK